jgi:hypothetical protein
MVFRRVKRGEIEKILFNLRAIGHSKTNRSKNRLDTLNRKGDRMQPAARAVAPRQGHVNRFIGQPCVKFGLRELGLALVQRGFNRLLGKVQRFARLSFSLGIQLTQLLQKRGELSFPTKILGFAIGQRDRIIAQGKICDGRSSPGSGDQWQIPMS